MREIRPPEAYGDDRDLRALVAIAAVGAAVLTLLAWIILSAGSVPLSVDTTVHGWMRSIEWDPLSTVARGAAAAQRRGRPAEPRCCCAAVAAGRLGGFLRFVAPS